jgi:SAM-dependent methyltransferase
MATPLFIWGTTTAREMEAQKKVKPAPLSSPAPGAGLKGKRKVQGHHAQPPTGASTSDANTTNGSSANATPALIHSSSAATGSSASIITSGGRSNRTASSSNPSGVGSSSSSASAFYTQRNGRTYIDDPKLNYPMPVDLVEINRQALRTLLLIQLHGAPIVCPDMLARPPRRVLEIGCGSGIWSVMCHRFFRDRGHTGISFVGFDICPNPIDPRHSDPDMDWTFVQHDIHSQPWPFADGAFDFVIQKNTALLVHLPSHPICVSEIQRCLVPGGVTEVWETDHSIRMLRPHVPATPTPGSPAAAIQEQVQSLGAYVIGVNTPLSAPLNPFLVEYNHWITRALESRQLMLNPCVAIQHYFLQEVDALTDVHTKRVAVPLSEVRWEREGVGGVVTRDGKSYVDMKGTATGRRNGPVEKKNLTVAQAALRRTALVTLVQEIQAQELMLREVNGKSQDEWDVWLDKMSTDLINDWGTSWGECLEFGAWWARKR